MTFYGIYVPLKPENEEIEDSFVFTNKEEALKFLKNHKEARLKTFKTRDEAIKFAQIGFEFRVSLRSPSLVATCDAEKATFRCPKSQELVQFRKAIEGGDLKRVREIVWNNPRYLVGNGDTPSILKEGTRYNALHVAALAKNPKMCELILQTVGNRDFVQLLHGKTDMTICEDVAVILVDLYLNMPEKGRNETALHLAVKFGASEVVEVLVSYPQCKMTPNSEGLLPKDVICARIDSPDQSVVHSIAEMLDERFYVPVIRSIDNTMPPVIGEPFSATNPPKLRSDPLSPDMEIQAYAGPMNKEQASVFRRRWKTPPRLGRSSPSRSPMDSPFGSPLQTRSFIPKFMENNTSFASTPIKTPRQLFSSKYENHDLRWTPKKEPENLPPTSTFKRNFLTYRDRIQSSFTGDQDNSFNLENTSLNGSAFEDDVFNSSSFKERHIKLIDTEKGLEVIGRGLAHSNSVGWKEYWHFLGGFVDISSKTGLDQLEIHLKKQNEKSKFESKQLQNQNSPNDVASIDDSFVSSLCTALKSLDIEKSEGNEKKILKNDEIATFDEPLERNSTLFLNAYMLLENSCRVYATRMAKTILNNLDNVVSINDALNAELKRLKSLVSSYRDDNRFSEINFSAVHSRFANLVSSSFRETGALTDGRISKITFCVKQILHAREKIVIYKTVNSKTDRVDNLKCFLIMLLKHIALDDNNEHKVVSTEHECKSAWAEETNCICTWTPEVEKKRNLRNNRKRESDRTKNKSFTDSSRIVNGTSSDNSDSEPDDWTEACATFDSDDDSEIFFTPLDSPTNLSSYYDNRHDQENIVDYNNFILGDEPTKTDADVLNALHGVLVDKSTYPHIFKWHIAIQRYSQEEREIMPSPSVVVRRGYTPGESDKLFPGGRRRLF